MADTITRDCRICGEPFDSIYEIDHGICDDCQAEQDEIMESTDTLEEKLEQLEKYN